MVRRHVWTRGLAAAIAACGAVALCVSLAGADPAIRTARMAYPDTPRAVHMPADLVRAENGTTWIADSGNNRVLKFSASGELLSTWTSDGAGLALNRPNAIALSPSGRVYVADTNNHRVVVIGPNGVVERTFGQLGSGGGQFDSPTGIVCDSTGDVFVADTANDRIQRFSSAGQFEAAWGSFGSLPGQFSRPKGLAVSGEQIFIADSGNKRIAVITTGVGWGSPAGWVTSWGPYAAGEFTESRYNSPSDVTVAAGTVYVADTGNYAVEACSTNGVGIVRWGSNGTGDTQFKLHTGVWADASGVWIADTVNNRILQHTTAGAFLQKWQAAGSGAIELSSPRGVARDSAGNTWVADTGNSRIQKYSPNGEHMGTFGAGDLNQPQGVALDSAGNVYVADTGNNRVRKFDAAGSPVFTYGAGVLAAPRGVALDSAGNVYVADTGNHMIRAYAPGGTLLREWGSYGTGTMQFNSPSGVALAGTRAYVSDTGNARVSQFQIGASVSHIGSWGVLGTIPGAFRLPWGVVVASDGNVWVCDSANDRIQEFTPDGVFVSSFGRSGGQLGEFRTPSGIASGPNGLLVVVESQGSRAQQLMLDSAPPVTTASGIPDEWSKEVTVTLTATDDVGVASTRWALGAGPGVEYTGPFSGLPEGQSTLYFASRDVLGREETTKSATVRIDRTAPSTSSNLDGGWHRPPFPLILSRTDALSGAVLTTYSVDAGAVHEYTGSIPIDLAEGVHTVRFRSTDAAGNVESQKSGTVGLDRSPPVTSIIGYDSQWRSTPVTLSLLATDTLSGAAGISYRIGAGTSNLYTGPFSVGAEGQTTVTYNAIDNVGNVEAARVAVVRIDRTAPVSIANVAEPLADFTRRITLSATDAGSDVSSIRYSYNGEADSKYFTTLSVDSRVPLDVSYWAVDRLGNREATQTVRVEWDYAPPVTTSNLSAGAWSKTPVMVSLSATDAMSPVRATYYRLGESLSTTYAGPFSVGAEGETKVTYWSTDTRGNVETSTVDYVRIDRTAPNTEVSVGDLLGDGTRLVSLTATDAGVGLDASPIQFAVGAAEPSTYSTPFPISGTVPVTVHYWSVDKLGNRETTQTTLVDDDFIPPVTTAVPSLGGAWRSLPMTFLLDATDAISGVFHTYYRLGESAVTTYTNSPIVVSAEGETMVTYWSVDNNGLREADRVGFVRIDRTPPTSRLSAGTPFADKTRLITISAEDAGVGGTTTFYGVGDAAPSQYTTPFPINAETPTTVSFASIDQLGNREQTRTMIVDYDYAPPVTTSNLGAGDWRNTPLAVSLTATDPASGVSATYYRVRDGIVKTYTSTPFLVDVEGETPITYWSVDNRSNVESNNFGWVRIDQTAPESTSTVLFDPYQSSAIVTLEATDVAGCGLGGIQYRIGTSPTWLDYMGGIYLGTPGDTVVHFRSRDKLFNTEVPQSRTVELRELVPVTTSDVDGGWHRGGVSIRLTASYEDPSVSVSTYYRVGEGVVTTYTGTPFPVTAEGVTEVRFWSVAKGVTEPPKTAFVKIDWTPPVTAHSKVIGSDRVTVTLAATDIGGSGVEGTYYRMVGTPTWTRYAAPFAVYHSADMEFRSLDNLYNEEAAQDLQITLDAPITTSNIDGAWHSGDVVVELSQSFEGVTTYYRRGASGPQELYTGPFTVTAEGETEIRFWSVAGGVTEPVKLGVVRIDRTTPVTAYSARASSNPSRVTVTLTATDAGGSGVLRTEYRTADSAPWTPYAVPFEVDQLTVVSFRTVDKAGNQEAAQSRTVMLVSSGTALTLAPSDSTPEYGDSLTLRVTLKTATGAPLSGQMVVFERATSTGWTSVGTAVTGAGGSASLSGVKPYDQAKTKYRARFAGTESQSASVSTTAYVNPHVYLTKGNAPSRYGVGARRVTGYLKPRHTTGSRAVRIYLYKKSSRTGAYVYKGSVHATISKHYWLSKYTVNLRFPSKGTWRYRAVMPSDSKHKRTYSAYDYVNVR